MQTRQSIDLAERILAGENPGSEAYQALAALPDEEVMNVLPGADILREKHSGRTVHLCTILNAKSGRCSEDCAFCAQSAFARTSAPVYPFVGRDHVQASARQVSRTPVHRFSIVTSGKRLSKAELSSLCEGLNELGSSRLRFCASLGTLDREDCAKLKQAGVSRYHHNLESSESFYNQICTTHSFRERFETIQAAKEAGLSVCAGGLFGIGETDQQVLELALTLKALNVDAVPLNFLTPIPGTRLQDAHYLTPLRCLKIIAIFRYVLPDKEILICGGREANLQELHPLIFHAGASGMMTGNYLTTKGRTLDQDLSLLDQLKFTVRA
ncbi:Biotin synthase [uncultured Desulfatiglans sp.]|uniref:Biotin synthase n=1 Tax=Uncultured Desulfatiglans sp. TaxID=1748965 RepID=A0A653AIN5_UNCDX|nr:Biotin synthase [uncultured Desulfatiglans sp.]